MNRPLARWTVLFVILLLPMKALGGEESRGWPFFAFCMDTHDSEKRTLAEQAALLRDLGYDGAGHLWLQGIPQRLKTLDEAGLSLFQVYLRVDLRPDVEAYDEDLKETLPLLKGRDTMLALLVSGMPPSDPAGDERAACIIGNIADLAAASELHVALYPHSGHWLERVEDAIRIADKVNKSNLGVMFNLCHWLKVDDEENLEPLLRRARPRLMAVSLHGADSAASIRAGTGRWIQPLGSGSFDVTRLLCILREIDYRGPIGLQCYGIEGDAGLHLERSMAAWRSLNESAASSSPGGRP